MNALCMHVRAVASEQEDERGVCLPVVGCTHGQMIRALPPAAVGHWLTLGVWRMSCENVGRGFVMVVGVELSASDVLCRHDYCWGVYIV